MANSSSSSSSGIGFFGLLGVAFIVLKLCKVIDWSWWLVTLPLWGGIGLVLFILLVLIIIIGYVLYTLLYTVRFSKVEC